MSRIIRSEPESELTFPIGLPAVGGWQEEVAALVCRRQIERNTAVLCDNSQHPRNRQGTSFLLAASCAFERQSHRTRADRSMCSASSYRHCDLLRIVYFLMSFHCGRVHGALWVPDEATRAVTFQQSLRRLRNRMLDARNGK